MISSLKEKLILNIKNIPGKSSPRKIVSFECDDWGGIRTPSASVYSKLVKRNLVDPDCRYRNDSLATVEDFEHLYSTLESVKDKNSHPAVMTPVINVTNPDFDKIRESGFSEYHYEKFTDTLIRYGRGSETFQKWKEGIQKGIFTPQLHGREHVSVQLWLQKLREENEDLLFAFDNEFISINLENVRPVANGFRAEFYFDSPNQIPFLKNSAKDSVKLFYSIFGFLPEAFVPSNAIFHPQFESTLAESGVKYLNVNHFNQIPDNDGNLHSRYFRNGKKTISGLNYYVRNCAFEPSDPQYGGIEHTLKQIHAAFKWNKPSIISTHRVNFVGEIDPENRKHGLSELKKLLDTILRKWPDVEFMSSSDMFKVLYSKV